MSLVVRPLLLASLLLGTVLPASAQAPLAPQPQANRIAAHPNLRASTRLTGHVPVWANAANDAGPAPADTTLRLTFVLSRSPERQAAFDQLLADQQNPGSPNYHHWLTPQQIGTLYGPTQNDLAALSSWLTSQGFAITETAPSGIFLTVDAPATTAANALATSFRNFTLRDPATGKATPHFAATTDPVIPSAFAMIVSSINGLADTPVYPMHHVQPAPMPAAAQQLTPFAHSGSTGVNYIIPADFAIIYNLNPAYQSGINGANQKVAIIGRSRVDAIDISRFETLSGLAVKQPNVIVPPAGADPGTTGTTPTSGTHPADQDEATLDVDRVLATAPGVQADLVVSRTVGSMDGVTIAVQYNVQTLLDPVMNISFGSCEANTGRTGVNFWNTLLSQAAAEGISTFVSSGDSGVDACESGGTTPSAGQPRSINSICASSYATCVGGTEFSDFASPSTYWSSVNGTTGPVANALSYIPEGAWNEPLTSGTSPSPTLAATGGGASAFITKPTWQTGIGVPANPPDGFRDVPDISFSASFHNGYFACLNYAGQDCMHYIALFSGTSADAPAMAGIAAMLNQKNGGPQGNINPLLYGLAAAAPTAFHDATPLTSGVSPAACGDTNTPSTCNNSTPSATGLTGGLAGYALTTGYDQATGLGSLDVSSFLTAATTNTGGGGGAAGFTLTTATSNLTIPRGATTGNTNLLTLNSTTYGGPVSLGCTVIFTGSGTASSFPTCSLAPATVILAANGSATSTLTITTTAASSQTASTHASISCLALGSLLLFALLPASRFRRALSSWQSFPVILLLLIGLGVLSGCGSGAGNSNAMPDTSGGTTRGSYTVTIHATSAAGNATTTLALTVQ